MKLQTKLQRQRVGAPLCPDRRTPLGAAMSLAQRLVLLLTILVMGANGAWAEQVTFNLSTSSAVLTQNGITISGGSSSNNGYSLSENAGGTITISSATNTITNIVFTYASSGDDRTGGGTNVTTQGYSYTTGATTATWTGNSSSVGIEYVNKVRITQMVVTYTTGGAPSPSPVSGTFFYLKDINANSTNVSHGTSMSLSSSDATIKGGIVKVYNGHDSNDEVKMLFDHYISVGSSGNSRVEITLNNALANGDIITIDEAKDYYISKDGTKGSITTIDGSYTVGSQLDNLAGSTTLYIWNNKDNSSTANTIYSITIKRGNDPTVTFNANGGSGSMESQDVNSGEDTPLNTNTFTNDGYTFAGWATTVEGEVAYADGATINTTADIILYAKWESTKAEIDHIRTTGNGCNKEVVRLYKGDHNYLNMTAADAGNNPFGITGLSASDYDVVVTGADVITIEKQVNNNQFYVKVTAKSDVTGTANVKIQFKGNSEYQPKESPEVAITVVEGVTLTYTTSEGGSMTAKTPGNVTKASGSTIASGTNITFTATPADWYVFDNWHDGTNYVGGGVSPYVTTVNADLNLKANFARYYKIATSATNGTVSLMAGVNNVTADTKIKKGTALTATATPAAGYHFVRWELTGAVNSTSETTSPLNISKVEDFLGANTMAVATLTAVFETDVTNYTITFNANGGTGTMEAQNAPENVATPINVNTFTRSHYRFAGWNTAADGSGTVYAADANITLIKNVTLYAQWTKNVYTCQVSVNNASYGTATVNDNASSASVAYNDKANYVATANTGYRFISWTNSSSEVVSTNPNYSVSVGTSLNLTANFEEIPKAVTTNAVTWTLNNCGNTGSKTATGTALYWNTQAGNVTDDSDAATNKLNGLKINSISDTYFIIPGSAKKGLLTVTYGARYPGQETAIAVTDQSPVYTTSTTSVDFNIDNNTDANKEIHITRGTSTAREGVITKIIWTPQQTSNLKASKAVEMLVGYEYVNTANISAGYSTSSKGALTYTSQNTDIVTVDANGILTAHKAGIATIVVNQAETYGYQAKSVNVNVNVNDLYATSNALEVQKNNNKTVTLTSSSSGAYTVTSNKESVATASVNNGIVTINGIADGEATITVSQAAVAGYPAASITIAVSVYTTKVYYDASSNEGAPLKLEQSIVSSKNYLKVTGGEWKSKSYNYEGSNQSSKSLYKMKTTSAVMKINVENAAAFEIFTVGGNGTTYFMNVDGQNVGIVSAESGTTSSGVFPCLKTGSTITITANGNDIYPGYIKFYDVLPTIIKVDGRSGFDNITRFVDAGAQNLAVTTNNSTSPITISGDDSEIANVTLNTGTGTLTVTPVKAGSFTMTLEQAANGSEQAAGSREITVNIKKHNITFTYDKPIISIDKNANPSATLSDHATLSWTVDGVATTLPVGVTVTYDSDDHNVALVDASGNVTLAAQPQGTAAITASIAENATYEATPGQHKISVIDGYNFKMATDKTVSTINKEYPIYDGSGEETEENKLVSIYYGGWRYGDHKYDGVDKADSWPDSKIYSRAGNAEKIYIDDYQQQTQANNDARTENKTLFKIGKPFSLPVRGAYMKFDAERTGVLTAYFVQNGDLNYTGENLTAGSDIARRPYFIADELGNIVTPISAMSKEKLPAQSDVINTSCGGNSSAANYVAALNDKELTPEGTKVDWTWRTTERQPVLYDEETQGYHVLQKAYVKYVFYVEAGKSYYVFSSSSKIGFAGANFQADDATKLATKGIAHVASRTLSQTEDYTAPAQNTWYDEVTVNRSFKAGEWSTIVLPFSICESKVKEIFGENTQLTVFNGVDGSTVNFFYHVDQNIIAGYPYIILPSKDVEDGFTVKNVTIDPEVPQYVFDNANQGGHPSWVNNDCDYVFKGLDGYSKSSTKEKMSKYSYYVSSDGLHRTTTGTLTCNGYRAYLQYVGAATPAKFSKVNVYGIDEDLDDDTITGIMTAIGAEDMYEPATTNGVYNLNGQKVADSTKNLPAGLYIVNGKKYVVNK